MEAMILALLIGGSIISGYNRGYSVRRKEQLNMTTGDIYRVFIPDDILATKGAEFRNPDEAYNFASEQRSAVIRNDRGLIAKFGRLSPNEVAAKSVRFEQKPYFKIDRFDTDT